MNRKQVSLSVNTLDLLKGKILKSAFEGKLVPQIEGEPEALQIGKAAEEMPFRIPKKWKWIRLDSLTDYIQRGKSPKYSEVKKIPVISQKCNQWSGFEIDKARFIDPDTISKYSEERKLQDLDLLWNSTGTGTIGRVAVYESKLNPFDTAVADSHVTVVRVDKKLMLPKFLYWFLRSPFVQQSIESLADGSTNQKELATRTIKNVLVPVPPLEEQKRIVEKVKCLFSKIDVIQKSMDEVSQLSSSLEKQLLQSAISGKLVPQLDEEPEVGQIGQTPEETPFEIPGKWRWTRLDLIAKIVSGRDLSKSEIIETPASTPYITGASQFGSTGIIANRWTDNPVVISEKNDLLLTVKGTVGKIAINKIGKVHIARQIAAIRPINSSVVLTEYLFIYFQNISSLLSKSANGMIPGIGRKDIVNQLIPLPPLGEQKRIVEKLDKLMLEIRKLK